MVAGLALMSVIVMLEPYRVRRLVSFSNPWADRSTAATS